MQDLPNHGVMALVSEVNVTEPLEDFDISQLLVVLLECVVVLHDVVSANQFVVYRNKEVYRDVY